MIKYTKGDITLIQKGVIAHQVNNLGRAATGFVSGLITTFPAWYLHYKDFCETNKENKDHLLGMVQYFKEPTSPLDVHVANMFSQFSVKPFNRNTNLEALEKCLLDVERQSSSVSLDVFVPYGLASVRGGMDWETEIVPLLEKAFKDSTITLYIVSYIPEVPVEL